MAINEDDRYALHQALADAIGREQAATLMASIPPTGWADVATKHDLRELEDRLTLRMEATEHRVLGVLSDRLRLQMQVMVVSFAGFAGVVMAAVRL